ncbi:MAG: glycosyltransferase [Candidatus Rifleibacteriota bacterium]
MPESQKPPRTVYCAFDTYPAPKGAAIHIREFSQTLFDFSPPGLLLTLGDDSLPSWQIEGNWQIRRLQSDSNNFLTRTFEFYDFVRNQIETIKQSIEIAHFRDPWGGQAILDVENRSFKTVFEVNALPSIELPMRYPGLSKNTLEKIRGIELRCLNEADYLICPSSTIKDFLVGLIGPGKSIKVIANGAELPAEMPERPETAPGSYLIYLGAVQSWQGIEVLFKAMQFLRDLPELHLVLCVTGSKPRLKNLQKLAEHLEISDRLIWNLRLPQKEAHQWLAHARMSVVPLVECSRNLVQGCCPLKIVESMAYAVPMVASDLPVVRELLQNHDCGCLVRPDRPAELARAIRLLFLHPERSRELGKAARSLLQQKFTWQISKNQLQQVYNDLINSKCYTEA